MKFRELCAVHPAAWGMLALNNPVARRGYESDYEVNELLFVALRHIDTMHEEIVRLRLNETKIVQNSLAAENSYKLATALLAERARNGE